LERLFGRYFINVDGFFLLLGLVKLQHRVEISFSLTIQESIREVDPLLFDFGQGERIGLADVPAMVEVVAIVCAVLQSNSKSKANRY
jgi:hypothetical protein